MSTSRGHRNQQKGASTITTRRPSSSQLDDQRPRKRQKHTTVNLNSDELCKALSIAISASVKSDLLGQLTQIIESNSQKIFKVINAKHRIKHDSINVPRAFGVQIKEAITSSGLEWTAEKWSTTENQRVYDWALQWFTDSNFTKEGWDRAAFEKQIRKLWDSSRRKLRQSPKQKEKNARRF